MNKVSSIVKTEHFKRLDNLIFEFNKKIGATNSSQGIRKSSLKGSSIEFSDFKNYSYGDDLKNVDWNSYARFDKLYVKLFMEEKQVNFNILLDVSKSMDFGEKNKAIFSQQLALFISYICLKGSDKVNFYSFSDTIKSKKESLSSTSKLNEVMSFLDSINYDNETNNSDLFGAIKQFEINCVNKGATKNGVTIIISDFLFEENYLNKIKILAMQNNDIYLVQVLSPEEITPKLNGRIKLFDKETGKYKEMLIDEKAIIAYKKSLEKMQNKLAEFCTKNAIKFKMFSSDADCLESVLELIR